MRIFVIMPELQNHSESGRCKSWDLHFHDLRGTAATRFYIAGLPIRVIAEILAWSEDQVDKIIRRYVARGAATKEAIRHLNETRKRT
jgi:integrase